MESGKIWTIKVQVIKYNIPRIRNLPNTVKCEDSTEKINIVFFNSREGYIKKILPLNEWISISGKVNFIIKNIKSLEVPVICFPKGIGKDYVDFCSAVKPSCISIDYEVDPKKIIKDIKIPIQGGLDPKVLLTDKDNLRKEVEKYLTIFKDHAY